MALKLRLKPHEKIVVNGAVIENGSRASELLVRNFAHILRDPDVMQENEADTPAKRVYFAVQLMLLDAENAATYRPALSAVLEPLRNALSNPDQLANLDKAEEAVDAGNYYLALRALRPVIEYEAPLLQHPSATEQDSAHFPQTDSDMEQGGRRYGD